MKTDDIEILLQKEEVKNNPELQKDLSNLLERNNDSNNYLGDVYDLELSVSAAQYLLNNNKITADELLKQVTHFTTDIKDPNNCKQLVDLTIANGANFEYMEILPYSISIADLETYLNLGMRLNKAAVLVTTMRIHNDSDKNLLLELLDFLLARNADFSGAKFNYSDDLPYENLLKHGLSANFVFNQALKTQDAQKHEYLLDLALSYKVDFKKVYTLPNSFTDLEKCFANGLDPQQAMKLLLNRNDYLIKSHLDFFISKGGDLKKIDKLSDYLNFETYQFLFSKGIDPSLILHAAIWQKSQETAKFALDNGADVNSDYGQGTAISNADTKELFDLLLSYQAKCIYSTDEEIIANDLTEIVLNPGLIFKKKYKNLDAVKAVDAKIPYVVFHVWLTHPDNPQEIREEDLTISLKNKAIFAKAPVTWEHIILTNDKNLFPRTAKELEDNGIKFVSIYDHQDTLPMFDILIDLIDQQKFGMASDLLREAWAYAFGGVYADINFKFVRHVTDDVHKFNYFTKEFVSFYMENSFFATSAHHPITEEKLTLITRNLINPPEYIANIKDQNSSEVTDLTTYHPSYIAFYKQANKYGNIDVVYPKDSFPFRQETKELDEHISKHCPDTKWFKDFYSNFGDFDNKCVLEEYFIGSDSINGQTWHD